MNPLVRRYLKTAIVFLLVGLVLGIWMLLGREFGVSLPWRIRSAHTHAVLIGFVMMMIAGVALWMFPRARPDDSRYRPALAHVAWWMIVGGAALRIVLVLELALGGASQPLWRGALVGAGVAQFVGLATFFVGPWPRIRGSGAHTADWR